MMPPSTHLPPHRRLRFSLSIAIVYAVVGALWFALLDMYHHPAYANVWPFHTGHLLLVPPFLVLSTVLVYWLSQRYFLTMQRSTAELEDLNTTLETLIQSSPLAIYTVDPDGRLKSWNAAATRIFGWEASEVLGAPLPYIPDASRDEARAFRERMLAGEALEGIETKRLRKDGSFIDIRLSSSLLRDKHGISHGIIYIVADVTEEKRAAEEIAEEKELLAVTLRSIGDGVITTDAHGHVVLLNQVAEELTGWTQQEAAGKPLAQVFHIINEKTRQRCENPVEKVLQSGSIIGLANHTALVARDGTERVIADSAAPIRDRQQQIIGVVLVFRDITKEYRLEDEIRRADKLESIGVLAGGIAHDFNNLLAAIVGNISLVQMRLAPGDPLHPQLQDAEKATLRARDLTQQLLTFARGGVPIKKVASIRDVIADAAAFALMGSKSRCAITVAPDIWPIEIDEGQINQVINNLVINADQAMPAGGHIQISASNVLLEWDTLPQLAPGHYIRIVVHDGGTGIPPHDLPKVFDPYFTTKEHGSGLGLATCYSIIQRHDGCITVESTPGQGTTFTLYLPATVTAEVPLRLPVESPHTSSGKILVVDDEEILREVVTSMLETIGYTAAAAANGEEAIAQYQQALDDGDPFDAVIMDLTIPGGFGGKEITEQLLQIDPTASVIVSSGYSTDPIMADYARYGFCGVIAKPYRLHDLADLLASLLQSADAAQR